MNKNEAAYTLLFAELLIPIILCMPILIFKNYFEKPDMFFEVWYWVGFAYLLMFFVSIPVCIHQFKIIRELYKKYKNSVLHISAVIVWIFGTCILAAGYYFAVHNFIVNMSQ